LLNAGPADVSAWRRSARARRGSTRTSRTTCAPRARIGRSRVRPEGTGVRAARARVLPVRILGSTSSPAASGSGDCFWRGSEEDPAFNDGENAGSEHEDDKNVEETSEGGLATHTAPSLSVLVRVHAAS
jgi:hypothetical protein